jgi:hypothetical protein
MIQRDELSPVKLRAWLRRILVSHIEFDPTGFDSVSVPIEFGVHVYMYVPESCCFSIKFVSSSLL